MRKRIMTLEMHMHILNKQVRAMTTQVQSSTLKLLAEEYQNKLRFERMQAENQKDQALVQRWMTVTRKQIEELKPSSTMS